MAALHEIRDVEIFATGEHNGDQYTLADLDAMVEAFEASDFRPPVKLGHSEDVGRPAYGWVDNLRRVGHKLVADLTHVPSEIYRVIKSRGYDAVSAEVYWNLKRGGRTFRRALKALALLGQDIPAVAGLRPLHALFADMTGTVKVYTVDVGKGSGVDDWWRAALPMKTYRESSMTQKLKRMSLEEAQQTSGEILDGKARLLAERSKMTYAQAFQQVTHDPENNFLVELYSGFAAAPHTPRNSTESSPEEAGAKLAVYAQQIARAENISIADANVRAVQQHPQLAAVYANLGTHKKHR